MTRLSLAVASRRSEPPDSLDYFPTPPWATRALTTHALTGVDFYRLSVREPCCGEGHMAATLAESFGEVFAADVFPYGYGETEDYLDPARPPQLVDWVITNPPFNRAVDVYAVARREARRGVALLLRTVWLHGARRFAAIFRNDPPAIVAPFAGRVAMVKGRWDPQASTATDYCWFVWGATGEGARIVWIPPEAQRDLTRPADARRFGAARPAPLLEGAS